MIEHLFCFYYALTKKAPLRLSGAFVAFAFSVGSVLSGVLCTIPVWVLQTIQRGKRRGLSHPHRQFNVMPRTFAHAKDFSFSSSQPRALE